jgi:hypothetical protein
MKMSCQCFAEMLIHFRFGKFLALRVGPICSKVMPKFCMTTDGSNSLAYTMQAIMVIMSERIVTRYLKYATDDMFQNNRTEIRCPCRKCKLGTLLNFFSSILQEHLLMHGFMDGHTQWISDEDDEGVHGAATGNEEG